MSRNSLILERAGREKTLPALLEPVARCGEYMGLIRRLFQSHRVIAVVGSGSTSRSAEACRGIAAELAASGSRVVIVQVDELLRTRPLPDASACQPGTVAGVSVWPSASEGAVDFFQGAAIDPPTGSWLGALRRSFDAVVLDCPGIETAPAAAAIAGMAEEAVLVVEAGRTARQQIQRDQQALQLRGVNLAGCILMRRR